MCRNREKWRRQRRPANVDRETQTQSFGFWTHFKNSINWEVLSPKNLEVQTKDDLKNFRATAMLEQMICNDESYERV